MHDSTTLPNWYDDHLALHTNDYTRAVALHLDAGVDPFGNPILQIAWQEDADVDGHIVELSHSIRLEVSAIPKPVLRGQVRRLRGAVRWALRTAGRV